jgi:hypothetical protein
MFAFFDDIAFFANIKGFREPLPASLRNALVWLVFSWPAPVPRMRRSGPVRFGAARRPSVSSC